MNDTVIRILCEKLMKKWQNMIDSAGADLSFDRLPVIIS